MISKYLIKTKQRYFLRIILALFLKLKRIITKIYDPLITYRLGTLVNDKREVINVPMLLPLSHDLPYILLKHPSYSSNIGAVSKIVHKKFPNLVLIDIGANIGDTIFMVKRYNDIPMLCIEGDMHYYNILIKNATHFKNVKCINQFVGEISSEIQGATAFHAGSAHIELNASNKLQIHNLTEILVEQEIYQTAKLLKIDTDGFDCKILRGAQKFLLDIKPVIFFEYDLFYLKKFEDDGFSIFEYLHSLNYNKILFYDNLGMLLSATTLKEKDSIKILHNYLLTKKGDFYYDIVCFHNEDSDLSDSLLQILLK